MLVSVGVNGNDDPESEMGGELVSVTGALDAGEEFVIGEFGVLPTELDSETAGVLVSVGVYGNDDAESEIGCELVPDAGLLDAGGEVVIGEFGVLPGELSEDEVAGPTSLDEDPEPVGDSGGAPYEELDDGGSVSVIIETLIVYGIELEPE